MSAEVTVKAVEKVIRRQVGRAIADYQMIKTSDHILIGLSGGKDSLTLLLMLHRLQRIAPVKFQLSAATLDQGFGSDFSRLKSFCESLSIPYHIHSADLAKIVFETRAESNPCALCSHLRRGALNNLAKQLGCNKLAYAHHADDAVETLLLNMFYTGQVASFAPATHLSRQDLEVIRPLVYVRESSIIQLSEELQLPILVTPCPAAGNTKRAQVKKIVHDLEQEIPGLHLRLLKSLQNGSKARFWHHDC